MTKGFGIHKQELKKPRTLKIVIKRAVQQIKDYEGI